MNQSHKSHESTNGLLSLSSVGSHNFSRGTEKIGNKFRDYFWGAGTVSWQRDKYEKHQIYLIKDKDEAKFITLSSLLLRFIGTLGSSS